MPPPSADSRDHDLVPLSLSGSALEFEVVLALLQSSGVPAIYRGRYAGKGPKEVVVPRGRLEEANQILEEARKSGAGFDRVTPGDSPEEPRSVTTGFVWIFAAGALLLALWQAGALIHGFVTRLLR